MRNLFTIFVTFLLVFNISASDQLNPSGAPGAIQSSSPTMKTILSPENLPEEKGSFHTSKLNNNFDNLIREDEGSIHNRSIESQPSYVILEKLSVTDRENSLIEIELTNVVSQETNQWAQNIQALWNNGNYEQAINELKTFEAGNQNSISGVGISWKEPKIISGIEGVDVQIGTRSGIYQTDLDFDVSNGNLFAALLFDDGVDRGWTANISTDGGTTWLETFFWNAGSYTMNDIDASVVAGYFWVGHISFATQDVARMRRFNTTDGMVDATYSYHTIFDFNIEIKDIAVFSNADYLSNRIYYTAITADDSLRFYFADGGGITWNDFSTDIADADHGLDATWNVNNSGNKYFYMSYVNSNGQLYSVYYNGSVWVNVSLAPATVTTSDVTSIAAYQDTIIIVYEAASDLLYRISYNGGTSWTFGNLALGTNFYKPHVTGRMNAGFAVVYSDGAPVFDPVYYVRREYSVFGWSTPLQINENDVGTAMPNNIEWIPPLSEPYAHGAIFWSGSNAYFDRIEDIVVPAPENVMALDGYDHAIPLYWDAPAGFSPLKTSTGSAIAGSEKDLNVQTNVLNTESVLLSYNVYRGTSPRGPYTMLDNVDRQYYRDLTASNGVTYYYVIQAVFDDAISGYSDEGSATAVSNGNVISAGWTGSTPNIDGVISAGEWVNATISDIKAPGITLPVTLFTMNDGNYLYFAIDDPNDTSSTFFDNVGIYFDENHDFEWGLTSPAAEGNFWIEYLDPGTQNEFRGIYGWWPSNYNIEPAGTAVAVLAEISFVNGHMQCEIQIDLMNSAFNASPGDDAGMYIYSLDQALSSSNGSWPGTIDVFGNTWNAPFLYGTLNLADDPTGTDDETPAIITEYKLLQNYPNPFNPSTTIKYRIAYQKPQSTVLQIYNNLGQLVRTLVNADQGNGEYSVVWNGLDNNNKEVASGIYFYKLQSGDFISSQKLLKLK